MQTQQQHGYMNKFECRFVHNRPRWWLQRFWEIPIIQRLGMDLRGKYVLEVGCGNGRAAMDMRKRLGAACVTGIDLDLSHVLPRARQYVDFMQADVTALPFKDESLDAVVGYGTLHHVVDWPKAVAEIGRVLEPGGQYCLDDFTASGLSKAYHRVFDAPSENRFTTGQLVREIERNGMEVVDLTHRMAGDVVFLVAMKK